MFDRSAPNNVFVKRLSEDPYLKSFISRVRMKYRERFSSFRPSVIRLPGATYFLSSLSCDDSTKAVKLAIGATTRLSDRDPSSVWFLGSCGCITKVGVSASLK